ncbi:hypothetical protein SAMN05421538_10666 [Paracoccus isoporae]|uniref:Uncharacterized protein n=1 Tax=Paracoccus isoporae TaxID=591205 RepID=A0A1G7CDY8_9RHOB|nr:hypothetical protein [Paracoccus isoporae]SDE37463.1 hypothetical protein SAMN05421538_10666 [Paracoccus isoporae]
MKVMLLCAVLAMGACGVDGVPERPEPPAGVATSGQASVGLRADDV